MFESLLCMCAIFGSSRKYYYCQETGSWYLDFSRSVVLPTRNIQKNQDRSVHKLAAASLKTSTCWTMQHFFYKQRPYNADKMTPTWFWCQCRRDIYKGGWWRNCNWGSCCRDALPSSPLLTMHQSTAFGIAGLTLIRLPFRIISWSMRLALFRHPPFHPTSCGKSWVKGLSNNTSWLCWENSLQGLKGKNAPAGVLFSTANPLSLVVECSAYSLLLGLIIAVTDLLVDICGTTRSFLRIFQAELYV